MTHPLALARQYAEQEADASTCRQLLRAALDEVDRLTRLPVLASCGDCGHSADAAFDGEPPSWECLHGDAEQDGNVGRCIADIAAEPPSDCPLRGKP